MRTKKFIVTYLIKEIQQDGTIVSSNAKYINPDKIVWMKNRSVGNEIRRYYTIFKLEGEEPFMAEGDIQRFLSAMDVDVVDYIHWDFDEDYEEDE